MARSLGVALRPDGWSYVLLDGTARKWTVRGHGSGLADAPTAEALGTSLSDGLKGSGKVDQRVLALPSDGAVLREISLPFSDREKTLQVLKFEVESNIYHLDIDEMVCDYMAMEDDRSTETLAVAAVPHQNIADALEITQAADVDPGILELDAGALVTAISTLDGDSEGQPEAFFHLGSTSSLLVLQGPDGPSMIRAIPLGWLKLARGVVHAEEELLADSGSGDSDLVDSDSTDVNSGDAADADPGPSNDSIFGCAADRIPLLPFAEALEHCSSEDLSSLVRSLAAEIRRGLAAASFPVPRVRLLGPFLPGLAESLAAKLGLPTERTSFGPAAEEDDGDGITEVGPDPIAFGAALRGLGAGRGSAMDFRQEQFRRASGVERVEGPLTLALVGLIAFFLVDGVILFQKTRARVRDTDLLFNRAVSYVDELNKPLSEESPKSWFISHDFSGMAMDDLDRIKKLRQRVFKAKEDLDQLVGVGGIEMPHSCLNAWLQIMNVLTDRLDRPNTRWMLERVKFLYNPGRRNEEATVGVELQLTVFGDEFDAKSKLEDVQRALRAQPWCSEDFDPVGGFPQAEGYSAWTALFKFPLIPQSTLEEQA